MMKIKFLFKNFSTNKSKIFPQQLEPYQNLLEKANSITEEIYPKKVNSSEELSSYLNIKSMSPNIHLQGNIPIDSINAGTFSPCWDLVNRGGKKWRPMLGLILAEYFRIAINEIEKNKLLYRMLAVTELIHNASLIIDDVEDKSEYRRGQLCVHKKFGEDIAINAGITMLYFPIYKIFKDLKDVNLKSQLAEAYLEEMVAIHLGQGWDIEMKIQNRIPTVDNYRDTVICKTGVCPRLMLKLIKILVNNPKFDHIFSDLITLIDNLSIAFQIRDDVLNIIPSTLSLGKGFLGEDIYEGKLTLMVLHTLNSNYSNKTKLIEILCMKTKNENLIKEAIDILNQNGSIQYANDIMNKHVELVDSTCDHLMKVDEVLFKPEAMEHLKILMNFLINRNV